MVIEEGQVDVAGTPALYWAAGAGDLVVILDDGGWGASQLQEALAGSYRVVRLELAGLSAGLPAAVAGGGPSDAQQVAALTALAVVGITDEKYTLIGAADSAGVALWHTLRTPDNVAALVLISPSIVLPAGEAHQGVHDAAAVSRLGDVACATLVVFGLNDRTVAPEAASVYKASIRNCNISFVYDAARDIMADRPEALTDVVADFVERRETFIVGRGSGLINP